MLLFSNAVVSLHTEAGVRSELAGAVAAQASSSASANSSAAPAPPLPPPAELLPSEPLEDEDEIPLSALIVGVGPHSL